MFRMSDKHVQCTNFETIWTKKASDANNCYHCNFNIKSLTMAAFRLFFFLQTFLSTFYNSILKTYKCVSHVHFKAW